MLIIFGKDVINESFYTPCGSVNLFNNSENHIVII